MDWRTLVLIASLLLNGYLFNSIRKVDFHTTELRQLAQKHQVDLVALNAQMSAQSAPSLRDLVSERDLDNLIQKMAAAETQSIQSDCGPRVVRNSARLRLLQERFKRFTQEYSEAVKKTTDKNLADPARIKQIAAQLKADVLKECKR